MRPLGLPVGSVRSVLALVLVVALVLLDDKEAVKSAAMIVIVFYFGARNGSP